MTSNDKTPLRHQKISYVRQMLGELRAISEGEGCDMLCYLIEMAYVEAGDIQLGKRPSSVAVGKRNEPADMAV